MDFLKSAFTKSSKAINLVARPISQTISSSIIKPVQQAILQHQNVQHINKCISLLRDTSNRPQFKKHTFFSINFKQQIHSKNIKLTQFIAQQLYQAKKSLKRYDKKSSIDEPLALIHNQLSQKTGIFDYIIAIWVDFFISQASKLKNVLQFKKTAQSSECTVGSNQFQEFQCVNIVIKRLLHRQLTILIQFLIIVIHQQFQDHFQFFLRNRKEKVKNQQLFENLKKGVTANSNFSKIKYFFLKNVQESQTRFNASEIKQNLKDIQKVFPIQKIPNSFQQTFSLLDSFYLEHNIQLLVRYLRQIDKKIFRDIMQYRQFYNLPKLKGLGGQQMFPIMVHLMGNSRKNFFGACQYLITIICVGRQTIDQNFVQDFIRQRSQKSYVSFMRISMHPVRFQSNIGLDGQIID